MSIRCSIIDIRGDLNENSSDVVEPKIRLDWAEEYIGEEDAEEKCK